jgi:transportin-1
MLIKARESPTFADYLRYIFVTPQLGEQVNLNPGTTFLVRYAAAIQLKNHIKMYHKSIPPNKLADIKTGTLAMLADPNAQLRGFAGTIITEIVQQGGLLQWPEILAELISIVENQRGNVSRETQEGAMSALAKVCEDNRRLLDKDFQGQKPMAVIVPKMLDFANHPLAPVRVFALDTLKTFIPQKSPVLMNSLNQYLSRVFERATDEDVQVRRIVCQSLVQLVESKPDALAPNMEGLVGYILTQQQQSNDPELALDAAEFWLSVGEQDELKGTMQPYLDRIIPVLLAGMVYGEEDVFRLQGDEADADQDDRPEDIKPQFAERKGGRGAAAGEKPEGGPENGSSNGAQKPAKIDLSDGEIEESDDDDDDDFEDEDPENAWSLRKCSAAALDVFAVNYHEAVFNIILPYLKENLSNPMWPRREAAVLALGAIAEGCMEVVSPNLPELVPYLISLLSDQEPVVRQITCWCLARYSEWAAQLQSPADKATYFEPMMDGLLQRMLDKNKKVQEAGASSFASLEEKAGEKLKPYTEPILRQFTRCFQLYKDKNMYILYDCLQTLADSVGSEMAKPELVDLLMPVLTQRWHKIADDSREMFPLLGCLGYIAISYGVTFSQFAQPIFARGISLIYANLQKHVEFMAGQSIDQPDKDFIVSALDLLSAIIQAIPASDSASLVTSTQPQFFDLLSFTMEDPTPDVRQSAYALLGDCAIALFPSLEPYVSKLLPIMIRQIDLDLIPADEIGADPAFNVLINVCWSAGEIGARTPPEKLAPFVEPLFKNLMTVVNNEGVPDAASENACLTLGRLGIQCPDVLAPHLAEYAARFLECMAQITPSAEKAGAYLGFNEVVGRNPAAMEASLIDYLTAVAAFPRGNGSGASSKNGGGESANGGAAGGGANGGNGGGSGGAGAGDARDEAKLFAQTRESFAKVLSGFKGLIGQERFDADVLGRLPGVTRQKLRDVYGL